METVGGIRTVSLPLEWYEAVLRARIQGRQKDTLLAVALILWDDLETDRAAIPVSQVGRLIGCPDHSTTRRMLTELHDFGMLERAAGRKGKAAVYEIVVDPKLWNTVKEGAPVPLLNTIESRAPGPLLSARGECNGVKEGAPGPLNTVQVRAPGTPSLVVRKNRTETGAHVVKGDRPGRPPTRLKYRVPEEHVELCHAVQAALNLHDGPRVVWTDQGIKRLVRVVQQLGPDGPVKVVHGYWIRHKKGGDEVFRPEKYFNPGSLFRTGGHGKEGNAENNYAAAIEAERRGWTTPYAYGADTRTYRPASKSHPRSEFQRGAPEKISDEERVAAIRASHEAMPDGPLKRKLLRETTRSTE